MVTKDELKKEVDKIPDNLLGEVYTFLKSVNLGGRKENQDPAYWKNWEKNLGNFSPDFMISRDQTIIQSRESFD